MGLSHVDPTATATFYDRWTELFHRGFGPVFQAGIIRTGEPPREDPIQSVLSLAERAGVHPEDRILDAGCGVAGPAIIIAGAYPTVTIDGVTNSPTQAEMATNVVASAGLADRVTVHVADFGALPFRSALFDQVLFFESTAYADDIEVPFREAHRVLKPGGRLYVKDVFRHSDHLSPSEETQMREFDELWGCVRTKTIRESADAARRAGFDVTHMTDLPDMGTARFVGSMVTLDGAGELRTSELGGAFLRRDLNPPIVFGELRAVRVR